MLGVYLYAIGQSNIKSLKSNLEFVRLASSRHFGTDFEILNSYHEPFIENPLMTTLDILSEQCTQVNIAGSLQGRDVFGKLTEYRNESLKSGPGMSRHLIRRSFQIHHTARQLNLTYSLFRRQADLEIPQKSFRSATQWQNIGHRCFRQVSDIASDVDAMYLSKNLYLRAQNLIFLSRVSSCLRCIPMLSFVVMEIRLVISVFTSLLKKAKKKWTEKLKVYHLRYQE